MATSPTTQSRSFVGPGLSPFKRIVTILGVLGVTALALWIAVHQGASAVGSTICAAVFILGFALYLRIIAPIPFTIELGPSALIKHSRNGEVISIPWENLARIKEEFFPNGKRISVTAYRKVTEPQQKAKAWAVYRDDIKDLDALAQALKESIPASCDWQSETVHE